MYRQTNHIYTQGLHSLVYIEAAVVSWINHLPCKPGVAGSIPGFTCLSDETRVYLLDFFCSGIQFNLLLSPYPCFISLLYLDLYVLGDHALIS